MNAQHTPGPWIVDHSCTADMEGHVCISTSYCSDRKGTHHLALAQVVWVMDDDKAEGKNSPECEANAHLIAAAPELLALLVMTERNLSSLIAGKHSDEVMMTPWRDAVRAAIAKAKGGAA